MTEIIKDRSMIDDKYKWDLTKVYKTNADFESDCKKVKNLITEYRRKYENHTMDNAKIFYDKLKNMKEKPIGDDIQNTYFLSLATAAYKNGENEEALKYLDMIKTGDVHILKVIEDERQTILGKGKNRA